MTLHILTLNWNGVRSIRYLKDSLIPSLNGLDWIWHIRDHASSDNSVAEIKSWNHPNVDLIEYKTNKENYSQGINFLYDKCASKGSDHIMTLNNDIVVNDTNSIKTMIHLMENDSSIGQCGAKLNYADKPNVIQHCGVLMHLANKLPYHYRSGSIEEDRDRQNRIYPAVTGAVSIYRGDTFVRHDEKYVWCFEDVDASFTVGTEMKKSVVYCGETSFLHEESATLKTNPVNKMFLAHNCKRFMNKWRRYVRTDHNKEYASNIEYNLYKAPK